MQPTGSHRRVCSQGVGMLPPPSGVVEEVAGVHSGVSIVRRGLHALERRHCDAESLRVCVKDYRPRVMQNLGVEWEGGGGWVWIKRSCTACGVFFRVGAKFVESFTPTKRLAKPVSVVARSALPGKVIAGAPVCSSIPGVACAVYFYVRLYNDSSNLYVLKFRTVLR